jgi:hypothetical protein
VSTEPGGSNLVKVLSRAQEAVKHEVCVNVASRDRPLRVDGGGQGFCGARGIEFGEGAVAGAQEARKARKP